MTDIQNIYSILLAKGYQDTLFSSLPGKRKKQGRETLADCPSCGKEGHFSYSSQKPVYRCLVCNEHGDWLHYLQKYKGYDFLTALQELASAAGVETTPHNKERYEAYVRKADILEAAQEYFMAELHDKQPGTHPVLEYLLGRGYELDEMFDMELGAYTDRKALEKLLQDKGYTQKEITESGLLGQGFGEDYQLTLLWRDAAGRAIGIVGRPILKDEDIKARGLHKYNYSAGLQKDAGMIGFSSSRGSENIVILEGVLDALYLNHKGFKSVAIGGTSLSAAQLQALKDSGTKELSLALDMDKAGQDATERMLKSMVGSGMRAYVVSLPAGYKDADELVRSEGREAFQDALDKAEGLPKWLARRIVSKQDIKTDRGKDTALEESLEAFPILEDKIQERAFMDSLRTALDLSEEELESRLGKAAQTASNKRSQALLQAYLQDISQKASMGDITGAEADMAKALREVKISRGIEAPEPYLLDSLMADITSTSPALASGFSKLDAVAKIPVGALTIIAGRPGHGKTSLQLSLLANLLRGYPERSFYFFTYEEPKKAIALKLIMIMSGVILESNSNYGAYVNYFKEHRGSNKQLEAAIQEYEELTSSGRLLISDTMYPAEDLASVISLLAKKGNTGAVIVDYIQRIPIPAQSQRYLDIKHISSLLLEQAVRQDIPIILGAQLSRDKDKKAGSKPRLDNLREGGDIEQDANLVLGLYTAAIEEMEKEDYQAPDKAQPVVDMELSILKNRGGLPGRTYIMSFNRPIYRVTDKLAGKSTY